VDAVNHFLTISPVQHAWGREGRLRVTIIFGIMKSIVEKMNNMSEDKKWILGILF